MAGDCGGCSAGTEARLNSCSALTLSDASHTASGSSESATENSAISAENGWSASLVVTTRNTGVVKVGSIDGGEGPDGSDDGPAAGGDARGGGSAGTLSSMAAFDDEGVSWSGSAAAPTPDETAAVSVAESAALSI